PKPIVESSSYTPATRKPSRVFLTVPRRSPPPRPPPTRPHPPPADTRSSALLNRFWPLSARSAARSSPSSPLHFPDDNCTGLSDKDASSTCLAASPEECKGFANAWPAVGMSDRADGDGGLRCPARIAARRTHDHAAARRDPNCDRARHEFQRRSFARPS